MIQSQGTDVINWIRRNGLVLLFPALVFVALFLPADPKGLKVGDSVPGGASVPTLEGEAQSLVGADRPIVLEFWASWCTPCKKSVPALNAVAAEHRQGVDLVAINVEGHLSKAEVKSRAQAFGYRFAVGKARADIQDAFAISHLPTLLVVYRGRVTYRHTGVVDGEELSEHLGTLVQGPL